jgi:catechol 2,3-dioxygenase
MTETPSLHPDTRMGAVALTVADMDRALDFYQNTLGFRLRERDGATATLVAGDEPLVVLTEEPGARPAPPRATGLYHFAILTPSRVALARSLRRLVERRYPLDGASDHLVSEALYLTDPDGHGIEIYRDRPRAEWPRQAGQIQMATDPLDLRALLGEAANDPRPWTGLEPDTTMGHVHLQVADIPAAESFYTEVLGFDLQARYGDQASFLSAGGYHHHLGANVWNSRGAPPPPAGAAALRHFTVLLPDDDELARVAERIPGAAPDPEGGVRVKDPSSNTMVLAVDRK